MERENKVSQKKLDTNDKYLKQLDDIKIRVPKGYKQIIKDLAVDLQYKGVNQLVIALLNEKLREQGKEEIPMGVKDAKEGKQRKIKEISIFHDFSKMRHGKNR